MKKFALMLASALRVLSAASAMAAVPHFPINFNTFISINLSIFSEKTANIPFCSVDGAPARR